MTTRIAFHSGTHTSGGTVISVVHGQHRLVFDFGFVFNLDAHVFDDEIRPGGPGYTRELLTLGLLPRVDGLFSAASLGALADEVEPAERSALETMVLVSHPHEDHVGGIGLVAPEVPVVLSAQGAELIRALAELEQFLLPREITGVELDVPLAFGPFTITARYSDHPAWGSVGFEIDTPDGLIFWTGDYRLHGRDRDRVLADLDALRERRVSLLLTEASSAGKDLPPYLPEHLGEAVDGVMPDGLFTEAGVDAEFARIMRGSGVVFANFYNRDFSPVLNLIRIADAAGRRMAFQADQAYILERMTGVLPPVYVPEATRGLRRLSSAEESVLERAELVTREQVLAEPHRWVVQLPYRDTLELLGFTGVGGSSYLHIGGTPLLGVDAPIGRLRTVLAASGIDYTMAGRHTHFAHGTPTHLVEFVERLAPDNFAVVHALFPDALVVPSVPRVQVAPGTELELTAGALRATHA